MKKILIVEDDTFIRDLYVRAFTTNNYEVEIATDGEAALKQIATTLYDMILLDIMLPKVTGIDVLKAIRAPNAKSITTPVFLITNLGQDTIIKEAFTIGADGYLLKAQLTPKDVVSEITTFFTNQDQLKQVGAEDGNKPENT